MEDLERQAQEKQQAEAEAARSKLEEDARQLEMARQVELAHAEASIRRRRNAVRVAEYVKNQAEEKKDRDEKMRQVYANQIDDGFFTQFGTSHR